MPTITRDDARLDDRFDARTGAAVVRTGLERHDHRRTARPVAGAAQRLDLRVRLTRDLGVTFAHDDASVADHERTDPRVRR